MCSHVRLIETSHRILPAMLACCLCMVAATNARSALFQQTQGGQQVKPQIENSPGSAQPQTESLTISKVFHVAGIPKVSRNTRGYLVFTQNEMIFHRGKRELVRVPFQKLRRGQLLAGGRDNAGAAVALAAVTYGIGGLAMAVQSKVDVLVFDYTNENGGLMGLALQVPKDQGKRCREWLARFGVTVEEPPAATTPAKK